LRVEFLLKTDTVGIPSLFLENFMYHFSSKFFYFLESFPVENIRANTQAKETSIKTRKGATASLRTRSLRA